MWIFAREGFFSVVKKGNGDRDLCVRARVREDLERLVTQHPEMGPIIENAGTDYPYRAFVRSSDWARIASEMAERIDYSNFKSMVAEESGKNRANLYGQVWDVMYNAENSLKARRDERREYVRARWTRTPRRTRTFVEQLDGSWEKHGDGDLPEKPE